MKKFIYLLIVIVVLSLFIKIPEKQKDEVIPSISIYNPELHLEYDEEYDFKDNIEVLFGESGGTVFFETSDLGRYIVVNAIAQGNNGLSSHYKFRVVYSNTENKNALFIGDSIVHGYMANMYSFADHIKDEYDFKEVVNAARSGAFLTPNERNLIEIEEKHQDDEIKYDFIILEGGINDIIYLKNIDMGEISEDGNFDINTFTGAFEKYIDNAIKFWPNARIGYIINYYTCGWKTDGVTFTKDYYAKFYEVERKVLEKYNIDYLDLFTDEYDKIFDVENRTYIPDNLHLNSKGQELLRDIVIDWMVKIPRYSSKNS